MKCVYQLRNVVTGYVYIGSTVNFYRRTEQHITALLAGTHFNYKLQQAFSTDGIESFRIEVLCKCDCTVTRSQLYDIEQEYLDKVELKYNIREKSRDKVDFSIIGIIVHPKHRELVKRDIRYLTNKKGYFINTPEYADYIRKEGGIIIKIVDRLKDNRHGKLYKYDADETMHYTGNEGMVYKLENILAKYSII